MISAIKSELRKLFSVRTTYFILGFIALLVIFFAFYATGYKADQTALLATKMASEVTDAISATAMFGSIIGVLLICNEYRYNTISYTLTSSPSRKRVFVAKLLVIIGFGLVFSLAVSVFSPLLASLGMHLRGTHLAPQQFPVVSLYSRALFMGAGTAVYAFILAFLIRSQVGVLVALFMSGPIELLIGALLKSKSVYLPFTALSSVLQSGEYPISHTRAAAVALSYMVVGVLVAGIVFIKRDAN